MKKFVTFAMLFFFVITSVAIFGQEVEPNNLKNQADKIGGPVIYGNIGYPGDVDWFVLSGQEGTNPRFTIFHAGNVDFDFEVFSAHNVVGRATGMNSGDSIQCNVPGQCFVRVWSCRGAGPYQIQIQAQPGHQPGHHPGGMIPQGPDEHEPNNTQNLADPVGGHVIRGTMGSSGDVDWFVLNGQEGSHPTFIINHAPGDDFDFEVYSNNVIVGRATGANPGDAITCNVPGRCHVRVWSCHGVGPYTITINR